MAEKNCSTNNTEETFNKIAACLEELSEAKGVAKCSLVFAMVQLVTGLHQDVQNMQEELNRCRKLIDQLQEDKASCTTEHIPSPSEAEDSTAAPES